MARSAVCLLVCVRCSAMVKAFVWLENASMRFFLRAFFRQLCVDASSRIAAFLAARNRLKRMLTNCFRLIHLDRAAPVYRCVRAVCVAMAAEAAPLPPRPAPLRCEL
jgi:hypothetical protein